MESNKRRSSVPQVIAHLFVGRFGLRTRRVDQIQKVKSPFSQGDVTHGGQCGHGY